MGWGEEISTLDWKARALKAEKELADLKADISHRTYKLTSTISGEEILGSILLDDDRLWQQLNDGFGIILAPVLNPVTHNLQWIHTFRIRQEINEWCNYYPKQEKVDPVVAMCVAYDLTKPAPWEQMDTMYTVKEDRPKRFKWLRNLFNKE